MEQFNTLLKIIPAINAALIKEGETVEGFGVEPMAVDSEEAVTSEPKRVKSKPVKSNIEATSDEDEG